MFEVIKIADKTFSIKFGMNALRIFCKRTGKNLNDLQTLGQGMSLDEACHLILSGIEDGSRKAGQDFELTVDELSDLLDEDFDALSRAMDIFSKQFTVQEAGKTKAAIKSRRKK